MANGKVWWQIGITRENGEPTTAAAATAAATAAGFRITEIVYEEDTEIVVLATAPRGFGSEMRREGYARREANGHVTEAEMP